LGDEQPLMQAAGDLGDAASDMHGPQPASAVLELGTVGVVDTSSRRRSISNQGDDKRPPFHAIS
jgi:hypothetical protein